MAEIKRQLGAGDGGGVFRKVSEATGLVDELA